MALYQGGSNQIGDLMHYVTFTVWFSVYCDVIRVVKRDDIVHCSIKCAIYIVGFECVSRQFMWWVFYS